MRAPSAVDFARGPTDNLYKFVALSGLALIGLGIVFANSLHSEWSRADIEASVSAELIHAYLDGHIKGMKNRAQALDLRESIVQQDPGAAADLVALADDIIAANDHYVRVIGDSDGVIKDARRKTETVLALESSYTSRMFAYIVLILLGLATTVTGFYLWFTRLQSLLDQKLNLELQAEKVRQSSPTTE